MSTNGFSSGFSDSASFGPASFASPQDDGITIRFPPGLGLIPPRDVPHHPRNKARRPTGAVA